MENRSFEVVITPCIVTRQFDRCIRVQLGKVQVDEEREAVIVGAFSRDGLAQLLADLESVPDPVGIPTPEEVREQTAYMWGCVLVDGTSRQQYRPDGSETPLAQIHFPEVKEFWIIPRFGPETLPWYGLIEGVGFVCRSGFDGALEPLPLPVPDGEPFEWQYYRNVTLHFGACQGQTEVLPPHVIQVLGWKIGETIFEIGVEEDGNYQVYRMLAPDDTRFAAFKRQELELPHLVVTSLLELVG